MEEVRFSFFISLILSGLVALASEAPMHIVIDPGHGGTDTGATYSHSMESHITLKVATLLDQILKKDPRFKSTLTRTSDKNLTLKERSDMANALKADLFLSIHANASPDTRAKGVELYFQNSLPPSEESLRLAYSEEKIQASGEDSQLESADVASIVADLKTQNKIKTSFMLSKKLRDAWTSNVKSPAIKQAPFYVISESKIPSVLVEIGFLTNQKENEKLATPSYQSEIAQKLYNGLISYKETVDKTNIQSLK